MISKYRIEKHVNLKNDKKTWWLVRKPITVIAEVYVKKDVELICNLLNYLNDKHKNDRTPRLDQEAQN